MLRGLGDLKDMGGMMKKLMDMKSEMENIKAALEGMTVEGQAGAGEVVVLMNGKIEVLQVTIAPSAMEGDDAALLETYVQAAMNDAIGKAQQLVKNKMGELTGGLDIPGLT